MSQEIELRGVVPQKIEVRGIMSQEIELHGDMSQEIERFKYILKISTLFNDIVLHQRLLILNELGCLVCTVNWKEIGGWHSPEESYEGAHRI
jgi:hypothetical protein